MISALFRFFVTGTRKIIYFLFYGYMWNHDFSTHFLTLKLEKGLICVNKLSWEKLTWKTCLDLEKTWFKHFDFLSCEQEGHWFANKHSFCDKMIIKKLIFGLWNFSTLNICFSKIDSLFRKWLKSWLEHWFFDIRTKKKIIDFWKITFLTKKFWKVAFGLWTVFNRKNVFFENRKNSIFQQFDFLYKNNN